MEMCGPRTIVVVYHVIANKEDLLGRQSDLLAERGEEFGRGLAPADFRTDDDMFGQSQSGMPGQDPAQSMIEIGCDAESVATPGKDPKRGGGIRIGAPGLWAAEVREKLAETR